MLYFHFPIHLHGVMLNSAQAYIYLLSLPYFAYFKKIKVGLWDLLAVCVSAYLHPSY
jgi:hypothetical protein